MPQRKNEIAVVGSLLVDQTVRVEQFPQPGETVLTDELAVKFGGKGANQAVAASRLGAGVEMIGCVGDDQMGNAYIERLNGFGIGTGGIRTVAGSPTGSAFIVLDSSAENSIVVASGANRATSKEQVEDCARVIAEADSLLLQNEVSPAANFAAIQIAKQHGTRIIYNPAPWRTGFDFDEVSIDLVVANEIEVVGLLGREVDSPQQLRDGIIVTRGAEATFAHIDGNYFEALPDPITPVDTVGAGDAFCGALAARLNPEGNQDYDEVLRFANRAAGQSTQKIGAQEAMPTSAELET